MFSFKISIVLSQSQKNENLKYIIDSSSSENNDAWESPGLRYKV